MQAGATKKQVALDDYAGRIAVVTGAGSGIGQALAARLASLGARLALLDLDGEAVEGTARQCQDAGAIAQAWTVDVTDHDALARCAAEAAGEFGHVDLLVCAAGVIHTGTVQASAWADTRRVVEVNLLGQMDTVSAFLPHLLASPAGHVVLCSSGYGLIAAPRFAAYSASKFGVRGYAEALAQEMALGGHPVRVTCVYPGVVRTSILRRGTFADGEDPAARAASFDRRARTEPGQAAEIILHRVRQGRARAVVGADARAVAVAERVLGGSYQRLIPWIGRRRARRR
jgi:NADP-dependent 3-hydroxy acid dehydrogenase YdfG